MKLTKRKSSSRKEKALRETASLYDAHNLIIDGTKPNFLQGVSGDFKILLLTA